MVSAKTKRGVTSLTLVIVSLLATVVFLPVLANLFGADVAIRVSDTRLAQFGGLIQYIDPFVIAVPNEPDGGHDMRDLWYAWGLDRFVSALYAGGGLLFLAGACQALQGVRHARRIH